MTCINLVEHGVDGGCELRDLIVPIHRYPAIGGLLFGDLCNLPVGGRDAQEYLRVDQLEDQDAQTEEDHKLEEDR